MKRFLRWLTASVGYFLYTALVLLLFLWVLLPADSLRIWLQDRLNAANPALRWEIKKLNATLPLGLAATGVLLKDAAVSGQELVQAAEVKVQPDLRALLAAGREYPFRYQLHLLDGNLRGKGALSKDSSKLRVEGEAANLRLDLLTPFWTRLGRTASGMLSGSFTFDGAWREPYQGILSAEVRVADGSLSLQQQVFGLKQLDFTQLTGGLDIRDRELTVSKGKVESKMLAGEFNGTVSLAAPLAMSEVEIDGNLEPRSELLAGMDTQTVALIKKQLQDNKMSFVLSGTMMEPGIKFQGVSGVIDGIMQGGGRQK